MEQSRDPKVDSFTVSCLNLGVGGAALLVIGLVLGGSLHPQSFGAVPVLLFLAFISGAGYVIWALLMKTTLFPALPCSA